MDGKAEQEKPAHQAAADPLAISLGPPPGDEQVAPPPASSTPVPKPSPPPGMVAPVLPALNPAAGTLDLFPGSISGDTHTLDAALVSNSDIGEPDRTLGSKEEEEKLAPHAAADLLLDLVLGLHPTSANQAALPASSASPRASSTPVPNIASDDFAKPSPPSGRVGGAFAPVLPALNRVDSTLDLFPGSISGDTHTLDAALVSNSDVGSKEEEEKLAPHAAADLLDLGLGLRPTSANQAALPASSTPVLTSCLVPNTSALVPNSDDGADLTLGSKAEEEKPAPHAAADPLGLYLSPPPGDDQAAVPSSPSAPPPPSSTPEWPFPWATSQPGRHQTVKILLDQNIKTVGGIYRCQNCDTTKTLSLDLATKFEEVREYLRANKAQFAGQAPERWTWPRLHVCQALHEISGKPCWEMKGAASMAPVIPDKHERHDLSKFNWLFLLLEQMLGCCNTEVLRNFCGANNLSKSGNKNKLVYKVYEELCRQLEPPEGAH